jgi:pSer/pThr/pTyr-binding forkhead associated (FHA) protein
MSGHLKEVFSEACGFAGPLELLVSCPGETGGERVCLFEQPLVIVGRSQLADLRLDDISVGQRHAYLQVIAGHLFCVDLDSRTGIHWEDGPWQWGWLAPLHTIRIGLFEIRLVRVGGGDHEGAAQPLPEWIPTETRLHSPGAVVEFSRSGRVEARCRLSRILTLVGRSSACPIRLASPEVSRYHCALLRTEADVWAIDLQGRGGIRVGGMPMQWARINDGDTLQVGTFELRLRAVSDAQPARTNTAATLPQPIALPAQRGALDPAMIGPVFQQMATMQQQMFDQFQQALTTMVQMFGALHREQMGIVREELDRLRALTAELHTLRAELVASPVPTTLPRGAIAGNGPSAAGGLSLETGGSRTEAAASAPPLPEEGKKTADAAAAAAASPPDGNIHAWLSQRIAALEEERQTRWQKLMKVMLGK